MSDAAAYLAAAKAARITGDLYEAAQQQRRAIALLRGGDPLALGHALRHLAEMLVQNGEPAAAAGPLDEMFALYRDRDVDPLERANALRCAALQAAASDDTDGARAFWVEARKRYEALGIDAGVAEADRRIAALRG